MYRMQVRDFLSSYKTRSQPFFDQLTREIMVEAKQMGQIPTMVVSDFLKFYSEGKRIRGALMELGYKICGGKEETDILRASLAMEMLQAGFLVQDDFMDKDEIRRGLPTLYVSAAKELGDLHLGNCMAVNMGDVAFFWMIRILASSKFSADNRITALNELSRRVIMVGYGQMLDVANFGENSISAEEVAKVHRYKTAEYTGALPLYVGALLAGEKDQDTLSNFQQYGLSLGWAFQIQDDILGIYGDEGETGKGVGTDLKEGRNTLFLTYLRQTSDKKAIKFIEALYGKQVTDEKLAKAKDIFRKSGVYQKVEEVKDKYANDAINNVDKMKIDEEYKNTLTNLVEFVVRRKS